MVSFFLIGAGCDSENCIQPGNGDTPPEPPFTADRRPRWIAYTHRAKNYYEILEFGSHSIWIVDLEASTTDRVVEGTLGDWSPDGNHIVFWGEDDRTYLRNLQTDEQEILPIDGYELDYSPCGEEILFTAQGDSGFFIHVFDLESGSATTIAPGLEPDWSPDCEIILRDSLVLITREGERLGKIPYGMQWVRPSNARWSPDGSTIAFDAYCDSSKKRAGIWRINIDGSGERLVACPGLGASWSPDGGRIAFAAPSEDCTVVAIWTMNADGTDKRQVTFP